MIAVSDLRYRYGDVDVLDGLTLSIPDGQYCLLVGPNGSGKTTLVRHFNALLTPDAGTITVDGTDVTDDPVVARTRIGMVFQHPRDQFVAATVAADVAFGPENLGLDRDEIDRRVGTALDAVDLGDAADSRIDALSGGEQARVAIAGALAMEPDYLVLDEPLVGLDWPARESVLDHLDALAADGTGIIVVTHDLRDLHERADRLVALQDGQVVLDASPSEALDTLTDLGIRDPRC
ncbi:ABC transporter ATP-binding protein [Haloarcula hispanica N601]|uniref:ABC transporter ATP-binding protein n=3 Tax=Haloarcula hispanica TaxID=51589 RepID=V5TRF3_HALHI|nr:ABC transporter ATP-binding protein [Haloarcula hispanica]AEM58430.1 ABC-type cobalt transport system, ATP binding protein [Haloarcula hispanica ATCC 33960]AHB67154.1 ABC transporter ATP-binding protein [Haloarcula hispanica N601]MCJ0620138.1 ABC transporter ATP-binding protein [Haloarcula hispanica]RYJ10566.1 ABC transporter ATP-binding protein [Haloarcula hispanica]